MALSVLFVGGTGTISAACVSVALKRGMKVAVINRGETTDRALGGDIEYLRADATSPETLTAALEGRTFDVVADFRSFTASNAHDRLNLLRGRVGQYIFISSASAYQTPPSHLPVLESTPLRNPVWKYSQDKIAAEDTLMAAYRDELFPVTIVRPSHTYDERTPPLYGGWTQIERMRRGQEVVVHGDGTSLWTLTHSRDFAPAFVGLFGHPRAIGESYHITSDEFLTWNTIFNTLAEAAGVQSPKLVHVTSDAIARADKEWGDALLGDMAHSMVFDNSKIRSLVPDFQPKTPFHEGAREIVEWFDADSSRRDIAPAFNGVVERLLGA